jgi:5-hydroxyisourate hydrolase
MATLSTHTLNAADGSHAGGVAISLLRIGPDGERTTLFAKTTDAAGRLHETIDLAGADALAQYELLFQTGRYYAAQSVTEIPGQAQREVVLRFAMPDPDGAYHMPLIMAPNGCSSWWSR